MALISSISVIVKIFPFFLAISDSTLKASSCLLFNASHLGDSGIQNAGKKDKQANVVPKNVNKV